MPVNKRDLLAGAGLAAALAAYLLPMANVGVDQHHDGIMLKPAFDVLAGQVLFRDSFTQYGALSSYLQALALWISPTLLSIRLLTVAAYVGTLVLAYASWRFLLPRSLAVVAGIFFILFIPLYGKDYWDHQYYILLPWSSVYAMLFQALGLYAVMRAIRDPQAKSWALLLGVSCAAVFWCRQPVGVTMAGALVVAALVLIWTGWAPADASRRAVFGRAAAGFLGLNFLIFAGITIAGAFPAWWEQNIVWPARWSGSVDWMDTLPFTMHPSAALGLVLLGVALALPHKLAVKRPGWSRGHTVGYFVILAAVLVWRRAWLLRIVDVTDGGWLLLIPLVLIAIGVASLWRGRAVASGSRPSEYFLTGALAAVSIGSLAQYYPMADGWHIFDALAPAFGLFVLALWRLSGWKPTWVAVALVLAMVPEACRKAVAMRGALSRALVTLEKPAVLRGMRVPPAQAASLAEIDEVFAEILRHAPDIPTALIGDNALYLCLGRNRENPIPYYVTWRGLASQPDNLRRWEYIHRVRPVLVLQAARWDAVNEFYRKANYVPLRYVPGETLEIAVPGELAARMGVGVYGLGQPRATAR